MCCQIVNGYLGCFYFFIIMSSNDMNLCLQVIALAYAFNSLGYTPRYRSVESF